MDGALVGDGEGRDGLAVGPLVVGPIEGCTEGCTVLPSLVSSKISCAAEINSVGLKVGSTTAWQHV